MQELTTTELGEMWREWEIDRPGHLQWGRTIRRLILDGMRVRTRIASSEHGYFGCNEDCTDESPCRRDMWGTADWFRALCAQAGIVPPGE